MNVIINTYEPANKLNGSKLQKYAAEKNLEYVAEIAGRSSRLPGLLPGLHLLHQLLHLPAHRLAVLLLVEPDPVDVVAMVPAHTVGTVLVLDLISLALLGVNFSINPKIL